MRTEYKILPIREKAERFSNKKTSVNVSNFTLCFSNYFQGFVSFLTDFLVMLHLNRSCYVLVLLRRFCYDKLCTENAEVLPLGLSPVRECMFIDDGGNDG